MYIYRHTCGDGVHNSKNTALAYKSPMSKGKGKRASTPGDQSGSGGEGKAPALQKTPSFMAVRLDSAYDAQPDAVKVRVSCTFRRIIEIDMAKQTYTIQFNLTAKWNDSKIGGKVIDEKVSHIVNSVIFDTEGNSYWSPRLVFKNKIAPFTEEEVWWSVETNNEKKTNETKICYNMSAIGTFQAQLHLQNFPVDSQKLSIHLISSREIEGAEKHARFEEDLSKDSIVDIGTLKDEYELKASTFLIFKEDFTDPNESAGMHVYPSLLISAILTRRPTFHLWNIFFPTFLLTTLSTFCFCELTAADSQNKTDSQNNDNRLTIVLTTLLATVQYRQSTSSGNTPCIAYLTLQDKYIIYCIGTQFLCGCLIVFWKYLQPFYCTIEGILVERVKSFQFTGEHNQAKCTITNVSDMFFVAFLSWIFFSSGFIYYLFTKGNSDLTELDIKKTSYLWIRGGDIGNSAEEFRDKFVEFKKKIKTAMSRTSGHFGDCYRNFDKIRPVKVHFFTKLAATQRFINRGMEYSTSSGKPFFALEFNRASEANKWKLAVRSICNELVFRKESQYEEELFEPADKASTTFFGYNRGTNTIDMLVETLSTDWKHGLFSRLKVDKGTLSSKFSVSAKSIKFVNEDSELLQSADIPFF